ncbi:succinate dehydrogenase / fumarate reductase membrane anchor subunit [Microbacteriaceae bacterium MWH-Ta3]|nr:succinate dehydrogenase / fumarate reductase membrane anchor subunit [Microbacteriaceae bacterium MWH-Ta3]
MKNFNLEKAGWLFMRGSGAVLIVLIFTHLSVNLLSDGGVKAIDFAFVAGKLANPFWQWFDVTLLWLALIHGANGMRTVINDYVLREKFRKGLLVALVASTALLIVMGTLVVFTLDPCPVGSPAELLPSFCPVA